jgi:enoyl-CoA hydratase/carnithine racemase
MSTMNLELIQGVHVLTLTNGVNDNTFNLDVMHEYLAAFDEVEKFKGNTALMITCEHKKTWTTGIDLNWMAAQNPQGIAEFKQALETMLYRLAMLNAPTLACINGNAYAGGALLFAAMDFRHMRQDRGRICYPEVDIKIPFTDFMYDLIDNLPNAQVLKRMALLGEAITGQQAYDAGMLDAIYPMDILQSTSFEFAKLLASKDRKTYTAIKQGLKRHMLKWQKKFIE